MAKQPLRAPLAGEGAVRAAAAAARMAVPAEQLPALGAWLRAAVEGLDRALDGVAVGPQGVAVGVGAGGMPLRVDTGPAYAMTRSAAELAAASRLGYVLVPRLAATQGGAMQHPLGKHVVGTRDELADDAFAAELELGA